MVTLPPPLDQIRPRLAQAFGSRFRNVFLFGSRARGTNRPDSDMDLLVLLDAPVRMGRDIALAVDALYPIQLTVDFPMHALPVANDRFVTQSRLLYRNVRREGLEL